MFKRSRSTTDSWGNPPPTPQASVGHAQQAAPQTPGRDPGWSRPACAHRRRHGPRAAQRKRQLLAQHRRPVVVADLGGAVSDAEVDAWVTEQTTDRSFGCLPQAAPLAGVTLRSSSFPLTVPGRPGLIRRFAVARSTREHSRLAQQPDNLGLSDRPRLRRQRQAAQTPESSNSLAGPARKQREQTRSVLSTPSPTPYVRAKYDQSLVQPSYSLRSA
jgi:hypothetical protein